MDGGRYTFLFFKKKEGLEKKKKKDERTAIRSIELITIVQKKKELVTQKKERGKKW